jgi:exosortase A-associated hydrolase 2
MQLEAFYLTMDGNGRGRRFCLFHPAAGGPPQAAFLYIHPFAEEMNKARRMAALQARALSKAGCAVLQIDLLGCGDSSGDFGDATWDDWVADVVEAARWLQRRAPAPLWLWGLRAGCLVAADAASALGTPCNFMFWQAPSAGKALLQQFLRLKAASDMLDGKSKGVIDGLRRQLADGSAVEIAGYRVSPRLAAGLDAAALSPASRDGRLEWLDISARPEPGLSPAAQRSTAAWREAGFSVRSRVVTGPAFWQTSEIEEAPELIDASLAAWAQPEAAIAA